MNQWYQKVVESTDKKTLFQKIFFARLVTLFVLLIISSVLLTFVPTFSFTISVLFLLMLIAEGLLSIADGYYLEKGQGLRVSLKPVSKNCILLLGIVFFHSIFNFELSIYLLVIGSYLTLIWFFPWKLLKNLNKDYFHEIKNVLKGGSHYALLVVTSFAYSRGDSLLINYLMNSQSLGLYSAAYRYLESLALLPTAIAHNLFPISAKKEGITLHQLVKMTLILLLVGLLLMLIVFFFAPFLMITIFGSQFKAAVIPLRIFGVVLLLFFINSPLSTIVQSSGYIKKFLPYGALNTFLNLALNFFLIPLYGINGAACAMVITEITGLFINLYFIKRIYSIK